MHFFIVHLPFSLEDLVGFTQIHAIIRFHHLPQLNITHHLIFYFLVQAKVGERSTVTSDRSAAYQAERLNRQKNPEAGLKLNI